MAKKATRKAAKKVPAKKLIEGKYSHKFLTRLNPQEGDVLTTMMKDENIKSFNGAVTLAVMQHKRMKDEITTLNKKVYELEQNNGQIVDTVADYIEVTKRLNSLKLEKPRPKIDSDQFICTVCKNVCEDYEESEKKGICDDCFQNVR